jgi:hypothetical protein
MKKLVYILFAFMLLSACKKDFLDRTPYGQVSSESPWDEDIALKATIGAYNAMGWDYYIVSNSNLDQGKIISEWVIGDIASDDAEAGGYPYNNDSRTPELKQINEFFATSSNQIIYRWYKACYEAIYRCNMVLSKVPGMELNTQTSYGGSLKQRIIGEVTFIRAYSYFKLVKIFGGVPLILEPNIDNNLKGDIQSN